MVSVCHLPSGWYPPFPSVWYPPLLGKCLFAEPPPAVALFTPECPRARQVTFDGHEQVARQAIIRCNSPACSCCATSFGSRRLAHAVTLSMATSTVQTRQVSPMCASPHPSSSNSPATTTSSAPRRPEASTTRHCHQRASICLRARCKAAPTSHNRLCGVTDGIWKLCPTGNGHAGQLPRRHRTGTPPAHKLPVMYPAAILAAVATCRVAGPFSPRVFLLGSQ